MKKLENYLTLLLEKSSLAHEEAKSAMHRIMKKSCRVIADGGETIHQDGSTCIYSPNLSRIQAHIAGR